MKEYPNDVENRRTFFKYFPDNFSTFNYYFGYDDCKGAWPLYSLGYEYVKMYFDVIPVIDIDSFCIKTIELSIGGK